MRELQRLLHCFGGIFDWDKANLRLEELDAITSDPALWEKPESAQALMRERTLLEKKINDLNAFLTQLDDIILLIEMGEAESDEETIVEQRQALKKLSIEVEKQQLLALLSGEADINDCFLEIHAGAGGTEAQDWALMLQRMYFRWAEKKGFKVKIIEESPGDEAGIKSSTLMFIGDYANGWTRTETGVHRLVRISPFDSSSRRHTSFASVWVYPETSEEIDIIIDDKDLKIDTYRASGAGGQHVNKTDSAIRITHLPTKIIVQCQSDRSQHRNKAQALSMLKAKLYELELKKREEENQLLSLSKNEIGWGSQIRSYVLHPYNLVKDLRTNVETGNTVAVLDGELDQFINESLAKNL